MTGEVVRQLLQSRTVRAAALSPSHSKLASKLYQTSNSKLASKLYTRPVTQPPCKKQHYGRIFTRDIILNEDEEVVFQEGGGGG